MIHSIMLRILTLLGLGAMLVACGGSGGPGAAQPTASSSAAPTATSSALATNPAPTAQAPTAAPATAAGAPTSAPVAASPDAIPQGLTPEGYHVLGRDDAPVTIMDYSDFL